MTDFKERFAEYNASSDEYVFSNVRNGLIVGLVCSHWPPCLPRNREKQTQKVDRKLIL